MGHFHSYRTGATDLVFLIGFHDGAIKWKHSPRYWPSVCGIYRSPVNSPHKGQWRGALMFSLICAWTKGWVNNGDAGDLRRHRAHYDIIIMYLSYPYDKETGIILGKYCLWKQIWMKYSFIVTLLITYCDISIETYVQCLGIDFLNIDPNFQLHYHVIAQNDAHLIKLTFFGEAFHLFFSTGNVPFCHGEFHWGVLWHKNT